MSTAQPSELACLPQEPQSHNEAQDLLLLQDYVCKLTYTLRTLEDSHALLQQTELLAGVLNDQDCRNIRTACCCIRSLRTRVEAGANVTEREVISVKILMNPNSAQRVPNPFRAVNKQVTQGTKPSVLNSLVTRATLWLSNTKSHGLLKNKRLLYQLRIPDQKLFQITSYATINDSDLTCS